MCELKKKFLPSFDGEIDALEDSKEERICTPTIEVRGLFFLPLFSGLALLGCFQN